LQPIETWLGKPEAAKFCIIIIIVPFPPLKRVLEQRRNPFRDWRFWRSLVGTFLEVWMTSRLFGTLISVAYCVLAQREMEEERFPLV